MTRTRADGGRHRATVVTWTLVAGATLGATAVAGVAAAAPRPTSTTSTRQQQVERPSHGDDGHGDEGHWNRAGNDHGDEQGQRTSARTSTRTPKARHQQRVVLLPPTSQQPSATSSGS